MKLFLIFVLFLSHAIAKDSPLKVNLSGNIEAQTRQSTNSSTADKLLQDWDQSEFSVLNGNLTGKMELKESRIEANWFYRRAYSPLYKKTDSFGNEFVAPQFWNFPTKLVARDIFKLQHNKQSENHLTDSVLNKFIYEWDHEDSRFVFGRMFINYGIGEIFNPINPFNQPTGLTGQGNVAQGNDGIKVSFFLNERSTMNFYLLGDKRIDGYEGQINKTAWVHGEYRLGEKWQFDYVFGEDQKRQKAGGQGTYSLNEGLIFAQFLYQSPLVNGKASRQLWDVMMGYDQQLTTDWHLRTEAGYQKKDDKLAGAGGINFNDRFLPSEYFVALANEVVLHPLVKTSFTVIHDIKTQFGYGLARVNYSIFQNWEAEIFGYSPIYKNGEKQNLTQKIITKDVGLAVRAFF